MLLLNRTQKRFFIIYFSFFICLLLMTVPIYFVSLRELRQNTVETSEAVLANGLQRLENELQLTTVAADTLYANQQIVSLSHMNGPIKPLDAYKIMHATTFFRDITEVLQLPSYAGMVMKNNKILANGSFYQSGESFYQFTTFITKEANDYQQWLSLLKSQQKAYSFTSTLVATSFSTRDAIIFSISLPLNTKRNSTLFFSVLDKTDIMAMLALPETLEHATLTLHDIDDTLLLSHDPGEITDHVVIRQTSMIYGLTAELKVDYSVFAEDLQRFKNIFLIGMAAFILVGMLLTFVYSQSNAKPIIQMLSAAENTCEELGGNLSRLSPAAYQNGYQYMNAFITQVDSRLKANRNLLLQQENLLKTNLFERLIQGEVFMPSTFEMARKYFPGFPSRFRMVLVKLLSTAELEPSEYASKQIELRSILEPSLASNSYIHFSANMIVIIIPCGYLDDRDEYEKLFRLHAEQMISDANVDIRIAVSAPASELNQLSELFHKLQHLLRMTGHQNNPMPIFIEDQQPIRTFPDYGKQHSTYFYEHIIRAQQDMAMSLLNDDIETLRQSGYVHEADVQQLFFAYRHALGMSLTVLDEQNANMIRIPDYVAKDNLDDTFADIKACLHQICLAFLDRQQESDESLERMVLGMIDDNLVNPELYTRMVTEHFSISESTLQRTMHKATGKSFFEYIEMKRMNHASELIIQTEQPINQIMTQCGYTSLNTFYKAFKRRYGMSPTAMRDSKHKSCNK